MGLDSLVRRAIATANTVTASLQADVIHQRWSGVDGYAQPTFSSKTRPAIVERKQKLIRTTAGQERLSQSKLTFLSPLDNLTATNRQNPVDERDVFTLPDGTTGPVLLVSGLVDPSTEGPYMLEVWLG